MDDREHGLAIYRAYREKVAHEDGLVNQRVFWFVTFQALLFTSFSLLTQGDFGPSAFRLTTVVFAAVGLGSALFTYVSVDAAFDAIENTQRRWKEQRTRHDPDDLLPGIVGDGRDDGIHVRGKYTAWSLPLLVATAWSAVVVIVFFAPDAGF